MRLVSALFFESCPMEVALLNCEAFMVNKVKEMTTKLILPKLIAFGMS